MHPVALDMLLEKVASGEFMPHASSPVWAATLWESPPVTHAWNIEFMVASHTAKGDERFSAYESREDALASAHRRTRAWRKRTEQLNLWTLPSRM